MFAVMTPRAVMSEDGSDDGGRCPALPLVDATDTDLPGTLELGVFSLSLDVADLDASRVFYEALGFAVTGGDADDGWLILKNGETTLGLFHGMFERNMLTFNPGLTPRMERSRRVHRRPRDRGSGSTGRDSTSTLAPGARQLGARIAHADRPRRQPRPHRPVLLSGPTGPALRPRRSAARPGRRRTACRAGRRGPRTSRAANTWSPLSGGQGGTGTPLMHWPPAMLIGFAPSTGRSKTAPRPPVSTNR